MKPIFIAGANLQLRERLVAFDGVPAFSAVSFRGAEQWTTFQFKNAAESFVEGWRNLVVSRLGDNAPAVRIDRVKDVLYCSVQTNVGHELARKRNHEHLTLVDVLNLFVQCVQLIDGFNEQNYYYNDDMLEGAQIFRDRDGQVSVWFPRIRPVQNRKPPSVEVFASFLNEFLQSGVELLHHLGLLGPKTNVPTRGFA